MAYRSSVALKCRVAKGISPNDTLDVARGLPEGLSSVSLLIDAGRLHEARAALEHSSEDTRLVELMRLKLAVAERRLEPGSALQSVLGILGQDPSHPAALGLYQEFSLLQYQAGHSCPSYSHPPPRGR